jgi:pimeloyl-ACP methyl ester carboxylesterase
MTTPPFHPFRSEEAKAEFLAFYLEKAKMWPLESETRLVDTPSGQTFVRVSGRATDPPLVLLPGARGSSLMWVPNIAALSSRYRTYALDLVNDIGLSVPRRELKTPDDLVDWLDEVLTALVPEGPISLMGMSYGGWLTSLYALRFPDRVGKAVLLAPGAAIHRLSFGFFIRIMLLMVPLPGRRRGGAVRRVFRWLFQDTIRGGGPARAAIEQGLFEMVMIGRLLEKPRMMWPTVLRDDEWRRFRVPALLLLGENEKIYSAKAAVRRINRLAPGIKTEIIPGAGHDLTLVKPDLVAERILAFLGEPATAKGVGAGVPTHVSS